MDAAIEEGAGGDDHLAGGDGLSLHRLHPAHLIVADDEGGDGILAEGEVLLVFEDGLPEEGELLFVALGAGAPHGGTFRAVEHPELDHGIVGHDAGHATDDGVARHLGNEVEVHRHEQGAGPHLGGGHGGFTARVTSTHHQNIKICVSFHVKIYLIN